MSTHRLTVRLDEDAWGTLTRICEINGISATAYLQAVVDVAGPIWTARGWVPIEQWDEDPIRDTALRIIDSARRIDRERRRRA